MNIYRCDLTLMEATFFSSREVSTLYQTEPLIGNYALAYALKFCQAAYFNDGRITYSSDLGSLNERGLYITPATFTDAPRFLLRTFNAQTDGYWSAYGAGVIAARTPYGWSEKDGNFWYQVEPDGSRRRQNATNRPQIGRMRMLAAENKAVFYILSREPIEVPHYIRLGKFMSKARVISHPVRFAETVSVSVEVPIFLNPADLPSEVQIGGFDMVNVPPTPLIRNAQLSGAFFRVADQVWLPQGMRFNVGSL